MDPYDQQTNLIWGNSTHMHEDRPSWAYYDQEARVLEDDSTYIMQGSKPHQDGEVGHYKRPLNKAFGGLCHQNLVKIRPTCPA